MITPSVASIFDEPKLGVIGREFQCEKDYLGAYVERVKCALAKDNDNHINKRRRLLIFQGRNLAQSDSYIKGKLNDAAFCGIDTMVIKYEMGDYRYNSAKHLLKDLAYFASTLSADNITGGIIVQSPFPVGLTFQNINDVIPIEYDVDGFNPASPYEPCTPKGILDFVTRSEGYLGHIPGSNCVVFGRGAMAGFPLAKMLIERGANVSVVNSKTPHEHIRNVINDAEFIFTAADKCAIFTPDLFKSSKLGKDVKLKVFDIGLSPNLSGKLKGNLCDNTIEYLRDVKGAFVFSGIGNVGLLTRVALMENVCSETGWSIESDGDISRVRDSSRVHTSSRKSQALL